MINFKKKRILLVGASGILGSEYAKFFHDNGARLIVSDIKSLKYEKLRNLLWGDAQFVYNQAGVHRNQDKIHGRR